MDTSRATRETLSYLLESEGYSVDAVGTEETALSKLENIPYNLAVVDVCHPEMEVTTLMTKIGSVRPEMPIIAVLDSSSPGAALEGIKKKDAFVTKPIEIETLRKIIAAQLLQGQPLQMNRFEKLFLESVDESLLSLGETSRNIIYHILEQGFAIERGKISSDIERFTEALDRIFGQGSKFLEGSIMKRLHLKLGSLFCWKEEQTDAADYLESAEFFSKRMIELVQKAQTENEESGKQEAEVISK
jgi:CheY-like chemotaxis protein